MLQSDAGAFYVVSAFKLGTNADRLYQRPFQLTFLKCVRLALQQAGLDLVERLGHRAHVDGGDHDHPGWIVDHQEGGMRRLRPIEFRLAGGGDVMKRRAVGSLSGTTRRGPYAPSTCWV